MRTEGVRTRRRRAPRSACSPAAAPAPAPTAPPPTARPGGPTYLRPPRRPGKYRTLPEPAAAVDARHPEGPAARRRRTAAGTAARRRTRARPPSPTTRTAASAAAGRPRTRTVPHLSLDFERVVSYDTAVSDDDRAEEVYAKKEAAAASAARSATLGGSRRPPRTRPRLARRRSAPPRRGSLGAKSAADARPPDDLQPRVLDDLGDAAFLDDLPTTAGSTAQHRTVTVVFRTSNVIVTVRYDRAARPRDGRCPDSKELQDKAQELARKLVEKFSE